MENESKWGCGRIIDTFPVALLILVLKTVSGVLIKKR